MSSCRVSSMYGELRWAAVEWPVFMGRRDGQYVWGDGQQENGQYV